MEERRRAKSSKVEAAAQEAQICVTMSNFPRGLSPVGRRAGGHVTAYRRKLHHQEDGNLVLLLAQKVSSQFLAMAFHGVWWRH